MFQHIESITYANVSASSCVENKQQQILKKNRQRVKEEKKTTREQKKENETGKMRMANDDEVRNMEKEVLTYTVHKIYNKKKTNVMIKSATRQC